MRTVVDRLPLELQRNADLTLEHDKQGRSECFRRTVKQYG